MHDMEVAKARRLAREERLRKEAEEAQEAEKKLAKMEQTPISAAELVAAESATPTTAADSPSSVPSSPTKTAGELKSALKTTPRSRPKASVKWNTALTDVREYYLDEAERNAKRGVCVCLCCVERRGEGGFGAERARAGQRTDQSRLVSRARLVLIFFLLLATANFRDVLSKAGVVEFSQLSKQEHLSERCAGCQASHVCGCKRTSLSCASSPSSSLNAPTPPPLPPCTSAPLERHRTRFEKIIKSRSRYNGADLPAHGCRLTFQ